MRSKPLMRSAAAFSLLALAAFAAMAADTPIYAIQGSGASSPLVSQTVTTTGVVTKVNNNGFFMQDPVGDGNPATSDGIFVFTSSAPAVTLGQFVRLNGKVAEFNTGAASNADTAAHTVTELTNVTGITVLADAQTIAPVLVTLPEATPDELERYEGMLVTLTGPLTVSQNYFLGRFGQLTLSSGGRLETPTNRVRPGPQALAMNAENARRSITLDDGTTAQNPNPMPYVAADGTVRAGDTVDSVTGVIDYGLTTSSNADPGDYKIHPTSALVFARRNPRTTAPDAVGGNLKLGSMNVLNFFTTFTNGQTADGQTGQGCTLDGKTAASNCRGANNAAEFDRQRNKIINAIAAINADALGLMEMQNNGPVAVQNLVDGLNAKLGAGTYVAVPDPSTGTGTDAIKVAMIYKPARLTRVGESVSDTSSVHNRPPLAQTFSLKNGERFTLVVNHLKSKGCDGATGLDADQGDLQGCWNNHRLQQAAATRSFVARVQASSGSNDVLLVGDFNSYAQEDPIVDFTGAGYVDLVGKYDVAGYSYVFNGGAGRLDQALATASLAAKSSRALEWHINADEPAVIDYNLEFKQPACANCAPDLYTSAPYRSSDHDPVVVGLTLFKTVQGTSGRDTLVGTEGDDVLIGGAGADVMTGGAGTNVFTYTSLRDAGDTVTDFVPGKDFIDLRALLASAGYNGTDPFADGWVKLVASAGGTSVQIDTDGQGPGVARPLVQLNGVSPAALQPARDFFVR